MSKAGSARQETMRQIYNTKMAEGTSVREHCLRMISNLNTLEVLGADINGESQEIGRASCRERVCYAV